MPMPRTRTLLELALASPLILGPQLAAQCELQQVSIPGFTAGINSIASAAGTTYATGYFVESTSPLLRRIAKWDGSSWRPLGAGLQGLPPGSNFPPVPYGQALVELPNGHLVVGGQFATAGGVPCNRIARWNGLNWFAMGSGSNGLVRAFTLLHDGSLVAAGDFTAMDGVAANGLARWDGSTWHAIGGGISGSSAQVYAVAVLSNGDLVASGRFTSAGGTPAVGLARFDGTSWSTFPDIDVHVTASTTSYALAAGEHGELYVGAISTFGGATHSLARWDGVTWHSVLPAASGPPRALEVLPDGDLLTQTPSGITRFDGASTSTLATLFGQATDFEVTDDGELYIGGVISDVGGQTTPYVAKFETPCPATVTTNGGGCTWSAGFSLLQAQAPAWAGSTFRTRGSGLPPNALAASVYGFALNPVPLGSLLPMTGTGCTSQTSANFVELALPSNGAVATNEPLPNDPSLAGVHFYHQLIVFELDAQGHCVGVSSSNALDLTIGVF